MSAGAGAGGQGPGAGVVSHFRDLRVWQQGMDLVESVYRATTAFPGDERYALVNQIRRAATSIPANIAEGHTRESTREYLQHLSIAQASLAELETELEIAKRLHYISADQLGPFLKTIASLGRQLYALRNALRERA
jgi:four helix bundle protein